MDITNYMTFDGNRPLHVFDADKVSGNLRVHRAQGWRDADRALDEKDYVVLSPVMMVISDETGAESIGGIMGGLRPPACTSVRR